MQQPQAEIKKFIERTKNAEAAKQVLNDSLKDSTFTKTINVDGRPITFQTFQFLEGNKNLASGLLLLTNVFTPEELKTIEAESQNLASFRAQGKLKGETVNQSMGRTMYLFGYHYQYYNTVDRERGVWNGVEVEPIKDWMAKLSQKLVMLGIYETTPDSLIFNFYPINGIIPPHIDHQDFLRPIVSLRLLGSCFMSFGGRSSRQSFGSKDTESLGIKFKVFLPRGSILIMNGYIANNITHSVEGPDVKCESCSITFRIVDQARKRDVKHVKQQSLLDFFSPVKNIPKASK